MNPAKHLTDEALVLLAGKRLSVENRNRVIEHLNDCEACRERQCHYETAHLIFEKLSEVGLNEIPGLASKSSSDSKHHDSFPLRPVAAIVLGCVCILFFFFYPRLVPQASASELLNSAIQNEDRSKGPAAFIAHIGGSKCAVGKGSVRLVASGDSLVCKQALQLMSGSRWAHGDPLSASTFKVWHDSLNKKRDSVTRQESRWRVRTTTEEGLVRMASLEMSVIDYRPKELTLQFEDNETLTISEDRSGLIGVPDLYTAKTQKAHEDRYSDASGDVLEAQAWKALHELHADNGWEATVTRKGASVAVMAVVDDEAEKARLVRGFATRPAIRLDIRSASDPKAYKAFMPQRSFLPIVGPPLAEGWLKERFPANDDRMSFANDALNLSQEILGRATLVNLLRQRLAAMAACSCAKDIAALLQAEEDTLAMKQLALSSILEPLTGPPVRASRAPLSVAQARQVDQALQELISGSSNTVGSTLDSSVDKLRRLL